MANYTRTTTVGFTTTVTVIRRRMAEKLDQAIQARSDELYRTNRPVGCQTAVQVGFITER